MTEEGQNVAIAEACGLKIVEREGCAGWFEWQDAQSRTVTNCRLGREQCANSTPYNYLHDLNAMQQAEEILDADQCDVMLTYLGAYRHCSEATWDACHATAAQRAEAFLRTLGKWTE